jgi:hypothetical protein
MLKPIIRMASGVLAAGAIALAVSAAPSASDQAIGQGEGTAQSQTFTANGHLRVPIRGNGCSVHGWPNFEPKCQFDVREPGGQARTIRVIAIR